MGFGVFFSFFLKKIQADGASCVSMGLYLGVFESLFVASGVSLSKICDRAVRKELDLVSSFVIPPTFTMLLIR